MLFAVCAKAQTDGYDPTNPPDPVWPEDDGTTTYTVTLEAIPTGAGKFSSDNFQSVAGRSTSVYAYDHDNCYFQCWKDAEGNVLTTEHTYRFTMPAQNVTYYAVYSYNPDSPVNPELIQSFMLSLQCEPTVAASFNFTQKKLAEGGTQSVTAYGNSGFCFKAWVDAKGDTVSKSISFNYLMPSHASTLTALFDYAPDAPANPGTNLWDAATGEMIVDLFTTGYLRSAMQSLTGTTGEATSAVRSLTVDGRMNSSDFNFINYYPSIHYVDLSRVDGITEIPSRAWRNYTELAEVELPEGINSIGYEAFSGCTTLEYIDCYAPVPPKLGSDVFKDVDAGLVVFVPESSVDIYRAAEGWKEFTISPLRSKYCTLEVTAPDAPNATYISLVNAKSGRTYRYHTADRTFFSFPGLIRNTVYNVYFTSESGKVQLKTDLITIDEDLVTLTTNPVPQLYPLQVRIRNGRTSDNYTDLVDFVWTDAEGNVIEMEGWHENESGYLVSKPMILPDESPVCLHVTPTNRGLNWHEPFDTIVELKYPFDKVDLIDYFLSKQRTYVTLKARFVDAATGLNFTPETIQIKSYSEYGDGSPREVSYYKKIVKASEYLSIDFTDRLGGVETIIIPGYKPFTIHTGDWVKDIGLTSYSPKKAIIQKDIVFEPEDQRWTIHPSITRVWNSDDAESHTSSVTTKLPDRWVYTLYNKTTDTTITDFYVDQTSGDILVTGGMSTGDEVLVGLKKDYLGVEYSTIWYTADTGTTVTLAGTEADVELTLYRKADLKTRYLVSDNAEVVSLLYDSDGHYIATADLSTFNPQDINLSKDGDVSINKKDNDNSHTWNVTPGTYTIITMGYSDFFAGISDFKQFKALGLEEGVDYVKNVVTLTDNTNREVRVVTVPFFDETKFYYTGENTSFKVNRSNTTVGNYLTFTARLDLRDDVKGRVKDVTLVLPVTDGLQLVDGSFLVGGQLIGGIGDGLIHFDSETSSVYLGSDYTDITKPIKFCVIPQQYGNYAMTPYIQFELDGRQVRQPIGTAEFTANALTFWTPQYVATPEVHLDGNAPRLSTVQIYDGNTYVGTATTNAAGYWSADVALAAASNLSIHDMWASIETEDGSTYTTTHRSVEYNIDAIMPKTIEMSFFNPLVNRTIEVLFDLERVKTNVHSYMFAPGVEFVFTADLTNNSPDRVHAVDIRVYTTNGEWIVLPATYIPNLERWVAHGKFTSSSMPIGVRAEVDADMEPTLDLKYLEEYDMRFHASDDPSEPEIPVTQLPPVRIEDTDGTQWNIYQVNEEDYEAPVDYAVGADTLIVPNNYGTYFTVVYQGDGSTTIYDGSNGQVMCYEVLNDTAQGGLTKSRRIPLRIDEWSNEQLRERISKFDDALALLNASPLASRQRLIDAYLKAVDTAIYARTFTDEVHVKQALQAEALSRILKYLISHWDYVSDALHNINLMKSYAYYGIQDCDEWQQLCDRILPCDGLDDPQARSLQWLSQRQMRIHGMRYNYCFSQIELLTKAVNDLGTVLDDADCVANEATLMVKIESVCSTVRKAAEYVTSLFLQNKADSRIRMRIAMREKNALTNCKYDVTENLQDKWDFSLPYPVVEPIIDPSGYVYEGVSTNRLEGVTATAYYRHRYEDMYGDLQEDIVLWDAEQYGQENPLLTDAEGQYQWDVPQGTWQVKFEKEGYETTYSAWLPVPPPQLDVNIPMKQVSQPEVLRARAFEKTADADGGVEITFDRYMIPATLTSDAIFIKGVKDGKETLVTDLAITYPTLETAIDGSDESYTTKVFAATDQLALYDEAYIIVGNTVESYASIPMAHTYQQKLDVEKRLESIAAEPSLTIAMGEATKVKVAALPTEAAAGRKVRVTTQSQKVISLGVDSLDTIVVTLDSDGQAEFTLNGMVFGSTALDYEIIDESLTALTAINVVSAAMLEPVKEPTASRMTGTAVFRGQTVTLDCETEGAQIYYTLDGTCPCESPTRRLYTSPIAINDAMTLNIMAVGVNGVESAVRQYTYSIRQANVGLNLAEGWNWVSHDLAAPLPVDDIKSLVYKVQTQTEEVINDPVIGFTGHISEILASEAVKIQTKAAGSQLLSGEQFNPGANVITLAKGWNWMGYPLDRQLTLADAFRYLAVEEGDVVTNLEGGFAEFADGIWTGTLTSLKPGQGYLYKAASAKQFVYNDQPTESLTKHRMPKSHAEDLDLLSSATDFLSALNPHRYPSLMAVTAVLDADHADRYLVAVADADITELRGVAQTIDQLLYITVYGERTEPLRFVAVDRESGELLTLAEPLDFRADVLGSAKAPLVLHIGGATGIDGVTPAFSEGAGAVYNLAGQRVAPSYRGVVIKNGKKVLNK